MLTLALLYVEFWIRMFVWCAWLPRKCGLPFAWIGELLLELSMSRSLIPLLVRHKRFPRSK